MSESLNPLLPRRSVFVEDAAALLGVSRRTVYYRIRDGRLQTIRTRGGSQRVLVDSICALLRDGGSRRRVTASATWHREPD